MTCLPKCIVGKLFLKIIASVQVREMQRVKSQYTSPIVQQLLQSTPIFIVVHQTVFGSALPGHMIQPSLKGFKIFENHSFRVSELSFLNKQLRSFLHRDLLAELFNEIIPPTANLLRQVINAIKLLPGLIQE